MVVISSAGLSLKMPQLHTVVWAMTSWERSQKNGMTICYQCDQALDINSFSLSVFSLPLT